MINPERYSYWFYVNVDSSHLVRILLYLHIRYIGHLICHNHTQNFQPIKLPVATNLGLITYNILNLLYIFNQSNCMHVTMIFGLLTYDIFNVFHISSMGKEHVLGALFIRHVNLKQSRYIAGLNYYFSVDQNKTANPN